MRKILPQIVISTIFTILFLSVALFNPIFAQTPTFAPPTTGSVTLTGVTPTAAPLTTPSPTPLPDQWRADLEVSFVGKTGVRSREFLDWTLQNYNWLCVQKTSEDTCDNTNNPLVSFWATIRNIVYAVIALFIAVFGKPAKSVLSFSTSYSQMSRGLPFNVNVRDGSLAMMLALVVDDL